MNFDLQTRCLLLLELNLPCHVVRKIETAVSYPGSKWIAWQENLLFYEGVVSILSRHKFEFKFAQKYPKFKAIWWAQVKNKLDSIFIVKFKETPWLCMHIYIQDNFQSERPRFNRVKPIPVFVLIYRGGDNVAFHMGSSFFRKNGKTDVENAFLYLEEFVSNKP